MSETPPPPSEGHDETGWGQEAGAPPAGAPAGGWSTAPSGPWGSGSAPQPPGYGFAPPDPAAVSGPPWPELVAVGPYTPPRMIRWPVIGGFPLLAAFVVIAVLAAGSTSVSHAAWLADHEGTINTLNRDQQNLAADNPSRGGNATQWLDDWRTFHQDAGAAASLPNPGGSATAPWREMVQDYYNGSAEIIQAIVDQNQSLLQQAQRDLVAGDAAAAQFNKAMGITSP